MLRVDERWRAAHAFALRERVVDLLHRFFRVIATSRANYRMAYVTDIACAVAFGVLGVRSTGVWYLALLSFFGGAFLFSFVEYALHRWLFHSGAPIWSELHASHHSHPKQPAALPFWFSGVSAPVFYWGVVHGMSPFAAHFFLCGFFAAYFGYGVMHHLQHSIRIKDLPIRCLRGKWVAHAIHHGREDVNFGVTTSFWDRMLGTYRETAKR